MNKSDTLIACRKEFEEGFSRAWLLRSSEIPDNWPKNSDGSLMTLKQCMDMFGTLPKRDDSWQPNPSWDNLGFVGCNPCQVQLFGVTKEDAIKTWNTRATDTFLREIAEMLQVYDENAEQFYSASQLKELLESRDEFLVSKGLFTEYVDTLKRKENGNG